MVAVLSPMVGGVCAVPARLPSVPSQSPPPPLSTWHPSSEPWLYRIPPSCDGQVADEEFRLVVKARGDKAYTCFAVRAVTMLTLGLRLEKVRCVLTASLA